MEGRPPGGKKRAPQKHGPRSSRSLPDKPVTPSRSAQQAVGNFLRATRSAQNLTQEQVASMTRGSPWQLSRAAISAIERGQNFPGMEAMLALSSVLYVDPKELVERARLSTVVPIDITETTYEELEAQASRFFWAGQFKKSLSVYDAMQEKAALEEEEDGEPRQTAHRIAVLDVRRATALKRAGALLSAIATAERAISMSADLPVVQAEAYVVLADLQAHRGHIPLARDAAQRAIELSAAANAKVRGWAWMVRARVQYLAHEFEEAKQSFHEARKFAEDGGDQSHLTHIAGDIGMCWLAQGDTRQAREWVERAVEHARHRQQPSLEASWLVELGKIALREGRSADADAFARSALEIAEPGEQYLTIFRAEWLRHKVATEATGPRGVSRPRLEYLRQLFLLLDQHEGIEEVREFKKAANRLIAAASKEEP